jgi:hypothetical protein
MQKTAASEAGSCLRGWGIDAVTADMMPARSAQTISLFSQIDRLFQNRTNIGSRRP